MMAGPDVMHRTVLGSVIPKWLKHRLGADATVPREEHNSAFGQNNMDHHRPPAISVPIETWLTQRDSIMERFGYLPEQACVPHFSPKDEAIRRLKTLLFMAQRAVVLLIHGQ